MAIASDAISDCASCWGWLHEFSPVSPSRMETLLYTILDKLLKPLVLLGMRRWLGDRWGCLVGIAFFFAQPTTVLPASRTHALLYPWWSLPVLALSMKWQYSHYLDGE